MLDGFIQEKLINEDFAIVGTAESVKLKWRPCRNSDRWRVCPDLAGQAKKQIQFLPLWSMWRRSCARRNQAAGEGECRLPGDPQGFGTYRRQEVKQILSFLDTLLETPMQALLSKGIEGRHWTDRGEYADFIERNLFLAEG